MRGGAVTGSVPDDGVVLVGPDSSALADSAHAGSAHADLPGDVSNSDDRREVARWDVTLVCVRSTTLIVKVPQWISTNALLMNVATWGTLLLELAIGILVWNRRCRPIVLAAGLVLHSAILVSVAVGFFTPAMFVLYLAFVSSETIRRLPDRLKHVVGTHSESLDRVEEVRT